MKSNNNKVEDYTKRIDNLMPNLIELREAEINSQAREIFFSSTTGKVYSLLMYASVPSATLILWLVFDLSPLVSFVFGLAFFYFVCYLFLYSLLISPIEKRLTSINNQDIIDSFKKVEAIGIEVEEMIDGLKK